MFSIDTTDSLATSNPSSSLIVTSSLFTIDTTDSTAVSTPSVALLATSGLFTIDTTDDSMASNPSSTTWAVSGLFTIDTSAPDASYIVSGLFTVDTTDPALANVTFSLSPLFTIDTLAPPPEDSNGNGLHDLWELTHFASLFSAGPADDDDHDGLTNFMEFAFGLDPAASSPSPLGALEQRRVNGINYMYFSYTRHVLAAEMVGFTIETSPDLLAWADAAAIAEELEPVQNLNGSVERVTVRVELAEPEPSRQFVRMRLQSK